MGAERLTIPHSDLHFYEDTLAANIEAAQALEIIWVLLTQSGIKADVEVVNNITRHYLKGQEALARQKVALTSHRTKKKIGDDKLSFEQSLLIMERFIEEMRTLQGEQMHNETQTDLPNL